MFGDQDIWKNVSDRDRRDLFDDVVHLLAKREKVTLQLHILMNSLFMLLNSFSILLLIVLHKNLNGNNIKYIEGKLF